MSDRMQALLRNATTLDESDAMQKIVASYSNKEVSFESFLQNVSKLLYKLKFSQRLMYVPSSEQLRFIMCGRKRIAVVAGAGSGKTRTMTIRIYVHKESFNVLGAHILPITFTKNSAEDMNRQYTQLCNAFGGLNDVEFRTIHKFGSDFISLINPTVQIITDTNPIKEWVRDESDGEEGEAYEVSYNMTMLLNQALQSCGVDTKVVTPNMFYSAISVIAEKMITSDQEFRESSEDFIDFPLTYEELMQIRTAYQQIKVSHNCIDFIDMLEFIHHTLTTIPSLDRIYQQNISQFLTFRYIYVDEVQDVSPLQIAIINELLRLNPDCNLCVVGDDDQSIYSFRGADPSYLLDFAEIYAPVIPDPVEPQIIGVDEDGDPIYEEVDEEQVEEVEEPVEIIYMTKNRRSCKKIINAANLVIKDNKQRYDKEMRPMKQDDGEVELVEDIHGIISTGMILTTLTKEKNKGAGILNHIGILYREHKQVIPILNMLVKNRIPFNCVYKPDNSYYAFNMFPTKDIIGIINMITDLQNPMLIQRYLYKLCPSVSKDNAKIISEQLSAESRKPKKERRKFSDIMKTNPYWANELPTILEIYKLIDSDSPMVEIVNTIFKSYSAAFLNRRLQDSPELQSTVDMSLEYLTADGVIPWLTFLSRHSATIKWVTDNSNVTNGVKLVSFHAAKGLEYDKVFILEVSGRYTPKEILLEKYSDQGREKYIEEERRLFYVALTRAKSSVTVFYNSDDPDSLFISELRTALQTIEEGEGQ